MIDKISNIYLNKQLNTKPALLQIPIKWGKIGKERNDKGPLD